MYEVKTKPRDTDVREYLRGVEPQRRSEEGLRLLSIFEDETGEPGVLWDGGMIGFGTYLYKPKSGKEARWFRAGFAPRKAKLVLYLYTDESMEPYLHRLGKHTNGVSCVYLNALEDADESVLREMVRACWRWMAQRYPRA